MTIEKRQEKYHNALILFQASWWMGLTANLWFVPFMFASGDYVFWLQAMAIQYAMYPLILIPYYFYQRYHYKKEGGNIHATTN